MLFRTAGGIAGLRVSCALLTAVTALLLGAHTASANHSYPATYTGMFDTAGTIEFDVSADGTAVTRVQVTGMDAFPCATSIDSATSGSIPISGEPHSFSGSFVTGTFDAIQHATGTYMFKTFAPSCTVTRNWTATTSVPPPQPEPQPEPDPQPEPQPQPQPEPQPEPQPQPQPDPTDTTAPVLALSGKRKQEAGKAVKVGVACVSEACVANATGFVNVPGTAVAQRLRLKRARANLAAGDRKTLRLRIPRKTRRAVGRALRRVKAVTAVVRVVVLDAAGNRSVQTRKIKLKR